MAAAAETSVNGDIDGNDNDKGNAGAFGQLGITEATSGSGDGRKMAVEEAAVYRKALAASASSRALGSGLSRREWARRLVRLSLVHRHLHARAQAALVPRRRRLVCRLVGLLLVLLPLLARPRKALALRRPSACRLIDLSLVRRWFVSLCGLGRTLLWSRTAADRRAASSVSRWFVGLCWLGRARLRPCAAAEGRAASSAFRCFVGLKVASCELVYHAKEIPPRSGAAQIYATPQRKPAEHEPEEPRV